MVDTPGAQIDEYVSKLDSMLDKNMAAIGGLRSKLQNFRSAHLHGQRTPGATVDHRAERAQVAVADRETAANHNQDEPRADPSEARSAIDGFRFADLYANPSGE